MNVHKDIKGHIVCFNCSAIMEFYMPDTVNQEKVMLRCPNCSIEYLIPSKLINEGITLKGFIA